MTDRVNGLFIALEKDIRTDDIEPLITAIRQMRGVLSVEKNIADPSAWISEERVRREMGEKLWAVLYPEKKS